MSKILAVFGATGRQGSSVIDHVLNDPALSQTYTLRAITRDTTSAKAQDLAKKIEVVAGDIKSPNSLATALHGAHTIFAMTTPSFDATNAIQAEFNSAKTIADTAVAVGASYLIFSTLPSTNKISSGKYKKVTPFEAKAQAESYVRTLPIKSAFYSPGYFMSNFVDQPYLGPHKEASGGDSWVLAYHNAPSTRIPFIDAGVDTGKYIGAILARPDKYAGQTFCAAGAFHTWEDVVTIMAKATGKKVVYRQVEREVFAGHLPFEGALADAYVEAFASGEEFGYWGGESEALVRWGQEEVGRRLNGLEEYWGKCSLVLE